MVLGKVLVMDMEQELVLLMGLQLELDL